MGCHRLLQKEICLCVLVGAPLVPRRRRGIVTAADPPAGEEDGVQ